MSRIIQGAIKKRKEFIIDRLIYSGVELHENRNLNELTLTELEEYEFLSRERKKADLRRKRRERYPSL